MNIPNPKQDPRDDQLKRLSAQLNSERARAARLQAALILEQQKVRQLHELYNRRDSEAWNQTHTIETLKIELKAIATTAATLQGRLLAQQVQRAPQLPAGSVEQTAPGEPPSAEALERYAELQGSLLDLERRLQDAVALVLDEWNTRKAAEARIRELEAQLAAFRVRIEQGGWPGAFREG